MMASRTTPTLCVFVMRDRPLEVAALLDPRRAGHLAVAVEREPRREHRIGVRLAARMHDGDAGANGALSDHQLAAAGDERRVSDLDAGDVGDRVERAGRPADRQLEVVLARLRLRECKRRRERESGYDDRERSHGDFLFGSEWPEGARQIAMSTGGWTGGPVDRCGVASPRSVPRTRSRSPHAAPALVPITRPSSPHPVPALVPLLPTTSATDIVPT